MPDLAQLLRRLADEYEREAAEEAAGEASAATEQRIAELEARLQAADPSPAQVRSALDDLDDEEQELIRQHRAARTAAGGGGNGGSPDGGQPPPPRTRTRPGRRRGNAYAWDVGDDGEIVQLDTAKVYQGEDEPDRVELPPKDDGGAAAE